MTEANGGPRSRERLSLALGGLALFLWTYAPLLLPGHDLWARDVATIHLPLRTAFARLLADGIPWWNPWFAGGQPVLSYPTYAAFYPLHWPLLLLSPALQLKVTVLLHGLLAGWGAFRFARELGGRPAIAWLAAMGFACGPWFVGLVHVLPMLTATAWLPWALAAGRRTFERREAWLAPALTAGGCVALQLLGGDAAVAVATLVGLAAMAVDSARRAPERLLRAALIPLAAAAFAAVQFIPTWQRFADSPRGGLDYAAASAWSLPPARLAEIALPFLYGKPLAVGEGLFFGWTVNDREFPYLMVLAPGALFLLGAVVLWGSRGAPGRLGWALAAALGSLLALGRHTPLHGWAWEHLPLIGSLRYPEKFFVLTIAVLLFAGALGLERFLAAPNDRGVRRLAVAGAGVALAAGASVSAWAWASPQRVIAFAERGAGADLGAHERLRALAFYRREALLALALAAAVALWVRLAGRPRVRSGLLVGLAAALLAVEIHRGGEGLLQVCPREQASGPPALARQLPPEARLYSNAKLSGSPELALREPSGGVPSPFAAARDELQPVSGVAWGFSYAVSEDLDRTATRWARQARLAFEGDARSPERAARHLAAWGVSHLVLRRSPAEVAAAARRGERPLTLSRLEPAPPSLARLRFVPAAELHATAEAALAAARAEGLALGRREHLVEAGGAGALDLAADAELLGFAERPSRTVLRYRAGARALLVVATTYDPGWRAEADGLEVPVVPTALGQIGLLLPAGEHSVELAYRDPWVGVGAAISAIALLAALGLLRLAPSGGSEG